MTSPKDIKEIAKEYNLGVSTIHGAESFYEFLRPSHREKKLLFAMEVHVCVQERRKN